MLAAAVLIGAAAAAITAPTPKRAESVGRTYTATAVVSVAGTANTGAAPSSGSRTGNGAGTNTDREGSNTPTTVPNPVLDDIASQATSDGVAARAADILGVPTPPERLAAIVKTEVDSGAGTVSVIVTHRARPQAIETADAFATALVEQLFAADQQEFDAKAAALRATLDGLRPQIDELEQQIEAEAPPAEEQRQNPTTQAGDVLQVEHNALLDSYGETFNEYQVLLTEPPSATDYVVTGQATAVENIDGPSAPTSSKERTAVGAGVGLLVGAVLALVRDRTDARIWSKADAEQAFGMPVVAEIPRLRREIPHLHRARRRLRIPAHDGHGVAEAYRLLRSSLMVSGGNAILHAVTSGSSPYAPVSTNGHLDEDAKKELRLRRILVTSSEGRDGRTTVVANLGVQLGHGGHDTILLDFDLHRPNLHDVFGRSQARGLADLLAGDEGPTELAAVIEQTEEPRVSLVQAGTSTDDPPSLLGSAPGLVEEAARQADVVLLDSAPLLVASDASELVPAVDAVLIVCRSGHTTPDAAARASERLARLGAPVCGVALLAAPLSRRIRPGRDRRHPPFWRRFLPHRHPRVEAPAEPTVEGEVAEGAVSAEHEVTERLTAARLIAERLIAERSTTTEPSIAERLTAERGPAEVTTERFPE